MDDKKQGGDSDNGAGWQFKTEAESKSSAAHLSETGKGSKPLVQWTASEYIEHKKGFGWYLLLFIGAAAVTGLLFWFTRDILSSAIIIILIIVLAVVAGRRPRVMEYRLDNNGLAIGDKFYEYSNFKSFTLEEAGPIKSITFLPLKRFMPTISVYFEPQDESKITSTLSQFLPYEQRPPSAIDNFMRSIRF